MEDDDIKMADDTFRGFFDSLGPNDLYKKIFLEVLLEELYGHPVDLTDVIDWNQTQPEQKPSFRNHSS
jgi:hypothetical protein